MSTIYLSSTSEDLKDYREAVYQSIRRLGHEVSGFEYPNMAKDLSVDKILHNVALADIYVGLFAHQYGDVPKGADNPEGLSITELEYREAVERGIPCLIFVVSEEAPWPPKFIDHGDQAEKVSAFRKKLLEHHTVYKFFKPDELAAQASIAIANIPRQESASNPLSSKSTQQFDAFFSYNIIDRGEVRPLAERLERDGVRVWMDISALLPGDDWARETEAAFERARVVCTFVGANGIGPNQQREVEMALERRSREEDLRLIPVLLPGVDRARIPRDLARYLWVDFSNSLDNLEDVEAYTRLKNAILGRMNTAETSPRFQQDNISPITNNIAENVDVPKASPHFQQNVDPQILEMLPELLFRLVARLRERPEMLRSLDATAFWAAVRKIQPQATTIEDLRAVNAQLSSEAVPNALWTTWMKNTRAVELTALLQHPQT